MRGRVLGHYRLLDLVGAGGMGEVYRARDERLDRDVAVKVLPETVASNPERLARFEREAKALARIEHPNILSIHDFGSEPSGAARTGPRPRTRSPNCSSARRCARGCRANVSHGAARSRSEPRWPTASPRRTGRGSCTAT